MPDFRDGSRPCENSEIEFANGNFVSTSIILKNKSAGDGCPDKTIEKTILRTFRARTFSRSLGHFQTSNRVPARSVDPATTDMRRLHRHVGFVPNPDLVNVAHTARAQ
jgi:hypothetical protein